LHEADVAFLDQVAERQAIARVAPRDVNDEPQVREHELAGSRQVVVPAEALGKLTLLLAREHRDTADTLEVRIEAPDRTGKDQVGVTSHQSSSCGHWFRGLHWLSLILALEPLEC